MIKTPLEFKRLGEAGVQVTWSDHAVQKISSRRLRQSCPCAACMETRGATNHEKPLTGKSSLSIISASSDEETRLEKLWPVGNYGLGILWGDGHQTGIYTYDLLYNLALAETEG